MGHGDDPTAGGARLPLWPQELRQGLVGYFRKRGVAEDDVDDLVQDVLLRLSQRGDVDQIEELRGYAFQAAASVLMDRYRRRAVRQHDRHVELDAERHGEDSIEPERILAGRQMLDLIVTSLDALPERTRVVFVLRRIEGMRYRQISERLGISVSAVEKHMLKALEQLARVSKRVS